MSGWRAPSVLFAALVLIGVAAVVRPAAALPGLPVIRWDPMRQVWVDAKTKGVVTVSSNTVTQPQGTVVAAAAAGPGFTQRGNTRPQRASAKEFFPLIIPDKDWWKTCDKNTSDVLTMMTTKCDVFKDIVNCQQLAQMGYLPSDIQSFVPHSMHGGFTIPNGCSSGNLGIEYDGLKMVFNSPTTPIMAVIAKDVISKVFYFGSGVTQGRLLKLMAKKVEFCYPNSNTRPLYVSKTAAYSTGMQPGSASWTFFKTAQLAPPFTNNVATLFRGDTADVTWSLQVQKSGTDAVYQGAVTGQITITNPQAVPVTVYSVNSYVQGGPQGTVSCGTQLPFTIPPCTSSVCNYVGYWPLAPAVGTYSGVADVSYTVGDAGSMGNQAGTATFAVGAIPQSVGVLNTPSGQQIQAGQAVVQDALAPQQYFFSGTATQTYNSQLTCPDTAIVTNDATLTAATGQTIRQTATVQKLCFDLQVRVAQAASPYIGKWTWDVTKEASVGSVLLKPSQTAWDRYVKQQMDLAIASGQDPRAAMDMITGGVNTTSMSANTMDGSMTSEVTYKVTYTRTPPGGFVAGAPAFQAVGDVFVTNTAPMNAQLRDVTVSLSNPFGGTPYTTAATCPILTVAAGQTLQCRYVASPPFNPIGAQVVGIANYLNTRNGAPTGSTTAFTSAATTLAGGPPGQIQPRPAPAPAPAAAGPIPQPVPQSLVQPSAARRHLLSAASSSPSDVNDALSSIVRRVSVTNIDGNRRGSPAHAAEAPEEEFEDEQEEEEGVRVASAHARHSQHRHQQQPQQQREGRSFNLNDALAAMDTIVGAASDPKKQGAGAKLVTDLLKGVVANMASGNSKDKPESGDGSSGAAPMHLLSGLLKNLNVSIQHPSGAQGDGVDVGELLAQLLPKLPSMGINIEGGDWMDVLGALRHALPDEGFAGLVKRLGQMPEFKMPKLPSLPKGPIITINSTGPGVDDDYEEHEHERLSKALTRLTHLLEHNNKSTISVTSKSLTPDAMLDRALETIGMVKKDTDVFQAPGQHAESGSLAGGLDSEDYDIVKAESGTAGGEDGSDGSSAMPTTVSGVTSTAPVSPSDLRGLSDECVDVSDAFAAGNGFTTGMVVSGSLPQGKVCDTTTFTYSVRYGPYADCWTKRAVNKASFKAADTGATGEASTTVNVKVDGCGPAVTASVKSYASWARRGYSWSMDKSVHPKKLQLGPGKRGTANYTLTFARAETLVAPKLSATVQFDNIALNNAGITLSAFSYKVSSNCPGGMKHKSGTFNCGANTIPAGGTPLSCKFKVDLPCAAPGTLVAHAAAGDKAIRSSAFNFPAPEPTDMPDAANAEDSQECIWFTDSWEQGAGKVAGSILDPMREGRVCNSKTIQYTADFGPYDTCDSIKAVNVASLYAASASGPVGSRIMTATATLPIQVTGCGTYAPANKTSHPTYRGLAINATGNGTNITALAVSSHQRLQQQQQGEPAETPVGQQHPQPQQQQQPGASKGGPAGANCVSPLRFWRHCMHNKDVEQQPQNGRCAVVQRLPAGALTPFFPQPGAKHSRNYKGVMGKPTNSGNKPVDMWFKAAQALVAAQLNELSGVVLPAPVSEAVSLVGSVVGTTSSTPPTLNMDLPGVATAVTLLEMFSSGEAGVEAC